MNVAATLAAIRCCLDQIEFAECLLFTDADIAATDATIRVVPVARMDSSPAYSWFLLRGLIDHIRSDHCLVVQWDGFVLDSRQWTPEFLQYDYIGARWPQFDDGHDVGNGGFSLRSKRLLQACLDPQFLATNPEDLAICRINRFLLEREHGIRFAPREVAERFSFERTQPQGPTFGFHGVFNMVPILGPDGFWSMYQQMDERSSVHTDHKLLKRQLGRSPGVTKRRLQLTVDRLRSLVRR